MLEFKDKAKWAKQCMALGAVNHLAEKTTYDNLGQEHMQEYAVKSGNNPLVGVWHPVRKVGHIFAKPKIEFSTKGRDFVQEKLKVYAS